MKEDQSTRRPNLGPFLKKDSPARHPGEMRPRFMVMMAATLMLIGVVFWNQDPELSTKFFMIAIIGLIPLALGQYRLARTSLPGWARGLDYGLFGVGVLVVLAMIARGNDIELGTRTWMAIASLAILSNLLATALVKLCFGNPMPGPTDEAAITDDAAWRNETVG